jgi:hypothetical protein
MTTLLLAGAVAITAVLYKSVITNSTPAAAFLHIHLWWKGNQIVHAFPAPVPGAENSTIFVSIPSYRDRLCMPTIRELFEKADNPNRIFVGVCDQRPPVDEQDGGVIERCRPDPPFAYDSNVQVITVSHLATRGLSYARYLAGSLYRNEEYFLAIDAHSRFQQGWDTDIIFMLEATPNPSKSVITHYPPEIEDFEKDPDTIDELIPILCSSNYEIDTGLPSIGAEFIPQEKAYLHQTPFLAGGMYFSKGNILSDVPLDPGLDFLFVGAELLFAARLWTSGFDLFAPTKNIIFHRYERKGVPYYSTDMKLHEWSNPNDESLSLARRILHFKTPFLDTYKYGLGTVRSLDAYYSFAGIDPITRKAWTKHIFCPDPLSYKVKMLLYRVERKVRGGGDIIILAVALNIFSMLFILFLIGYLLSNKKV